MLSFYLLAMYQKYKRFNLRIEPLPVVNRWSRLRYSSKKALPFSLGAFFTHFWIVRLAIFKVVTYDIGTCSR